MKTLAITGYRCFESFRLKNLSSVNLFVGQNNSGKTSLLEAIHILATGSLTTCWGLAERRGEVQIEINPHSPSNRLLDVCHMFCGHKISPESKLSIKSNQHSFSLRFTKMRRKRNEQGQLVFEELKETIDEGDEYLEVKSSLGKRAVRLKEGNTIDFRRIRNIDSKIDSDDPPFPSVYLPTGRQENQELQERWDNIALTPKEDKVIEASRIIEPRIQRLAFVGSGSRSRMLVKLEGEEHPIPLGSLGDGVRRVIALALAMAHAENGFLLVDELETGLYYRTQRKVWDFLIEASALLNIQLFVTTHSQDCLEAFADSLENREEAGSLIRLSRKKNKIVPVYYSPDELKTTLKQEIEVR